MSQQSVDEVEEHRFGGDMAAMGDVSQLTGKLHIKSNVYDGVARGALRPLSLAERTGLSGGGHCAAGLMKHNGYHAISADH